ncbi:MAG: DUF6788 family protein [Candidatus Dormibacteraceae bacterium]
MKAPPDRLQELQRRQHDLARQVLDLGFVQKGSLVLRHTYCRTPGCRCHANPPQPHGPYWQWTRYESGRTLTRRLTDRQAAIYREGIENRQRLQRIMTDMEAIGEEARNLLLQRNEDAQGRIEPTTRRTPRARA